MRKTKKIAIFVAGTDTGVGKTIITGLLARYFVRKGLRTVTQKWVQTGCPGGRSSDLFAHIRLMGKSDGEFAPYLRYMMPYCFSYPASPHLAARSEHKKISPAKILGSLTRLKEDFDVVIVEGSGGLMVPVDDKYTMIDILKRSGLPVLIVAENRLGAVNQTILTIEALKRRNIGIIGVVFNQVRKGERKAILDDNPAIVERLTDVCNLGILRSRKNVERLYGELTKIALKIFERSFK